MKIPKWFSKKQDKTFFNFQGRPRSLWWAWWGYRLAIRRTKDCRGCKYYGLYYPVCDECSRGCLDHYKKTRQEADRT